LYYKIYEKYTKKFYGVTDPEITCVPILSLLYGVNFLILNTYINLFLEINWSEKKFFESISLMDMPAILLLLFFFGFNYYRYLKVKKIDEIKADFEKNPVPSIFKIGSKAFVLLTIINLLVYIFTG